MFAINKTQSNLMLRGGRLQIPRGSCIEVTEEDMAGADFKYAIQHGKIVYSKTKEEDVPAPALVFHNSVPSGMTEAQLKEELAKRKEAPVQEAQATPLSVETVNVEDAQSVQIAAPEVTPEAEPVEVKPTRRSKKG